MTAHEDRLQFRVDGDTAAWLAGRAQRMPLARDRRSTDTSVINQQARAELALWRTALDAELRRIRLTLAQAMCIADVMNGTVLDAAVAAGIGIAYAECYDAFRLARRGPFPDVSSYGAEHGPEGCDPGKWEQELLDQLGTLGPAADHALRDAISRWWESGGEPDAGGFAAAGLRVAE